MSDVHARLEASLPNAQRVSFVHNDLKLDNCMFEPSNPDRVIAFFDWDMTTLGDPLIDFGTLLNYWAAKLVFSIASRKGQTSGSPYLWNSTWIPRRLTIHAISSMAKTLRSQVAKCFLSKITRLTRWSPYVCSKNFNAASSFQ